MAEPPRDSVRNGRLEGGLVQHGAEGEPGQGRLTVDQVFRFLAHAVPDRIDRTREEFRGILFQAGLNHGEILRARRQGRS